MPPPSLKHAIPYPDVMVDLLRNVDVAAGGKPLKAGRGVHLADLEMILVKQQIHARDVEA